jgi:integrase
MAENILSDAKLRTAARERDGAYLADGGGLRIRLLPASAKHPKGARLAEFHFKLRDAAGDYRNGAIHLGTIGDPFTDPAGAVRPFTLRDAREARDAAREMVSRGIDPREARRLAEVEAAESQRRRLLALESRRTVRQAFERWRELYLSAHHKDGGAMVADLYERHILPAIGETPLEELRRHQVTDMLDSITSKGLRRTANMALASVRQLVRWCQLRDWIAADPTLALTKAAAGGKESPRKRVLSALAVVKLRDALPGAKLPVRLQHALWLLLATGARVSELSGARVADFDLQARLWRIPETKNGEPHTVHLSDFALLHVEALLKLRGTSAFMLPGRSSDDEPDAPINDKFISKAIHDRQRETPLKGRSKRAGSLALPGGKWTPHDLRRTMATRMRDLGVSSDTIERCLNHKPQGIVSVYQHAELMPERRAAFESWGAELERLMALDASNVVALPEARTA